MVGRLNFSMDYSSSNSDRKCNVSDKINICILGDFSGSTSRKDSGFFYKLEVDNINDVIKKIGPSIGIPMPNKETLNISFKEIEDFHPDKLFTQIDFEKYSQVISDVVKGEASNDIEPASEADTGVGPGMLEELMSKEISIKSESRFREEPIISELLKEAVKQHIVYEDVKEIADRKNREKLYAIIMRHILHSNEFKNLEAAWLSLDFILSTFEEDDENINIYIMDISKAELTHALKNSKEVTETAVFNSLRDKFSSYTGDSWSLLVGNYRFGINYDDIHSLRKLTELTNALDVPFLAAGDLPTALRFDKEPEFSKIIKDCGKLGVEWDSLRSMKGTENIILTYPGFILRYPYTQKDDPIESFHFEEIDSAPDHNSFLWGNSAFLCCSILLNEGIRCDFNKVMNRSIKMTELPLISLKVGDSKFIIPCAETVMSDRKVDDLEALGLSPIISVKNDNAVYCKFLPLKA